MTKFKNKYRIEPNRCQYIDYSAPGLYFITICIINRQCILGDVHQGKMMLSELGNIVKTEIEKMPEYHKRVILDEWVVMPNHVHLLIELGQYNYHNGVAINIDGDAGDGCGYGGGNGNVEKIHEFSLPPHHPEQQQQQQQQQQPPIYWWHNVNYQPTPDDIKQYRLYRRNMIIPKILGKFQMQSSKNMNIAQNTQGQKNWQPNYHDHVVRDEASYYRIKYYIRNNPKNWPGDSFFK